MTDPKVEDLARQFCIEMGFNPDGYPTIKSTVYVEEALPFAKNISGVNWQHMANEAYKRLYHQRELAWQRAIAKVKDRE